MIGRIEETSASFEARSAPRSYPTPITGLMLWTTACAFDYCNVNQNFATNVALHQREVRPWGFRTGSMLPPGAALGSPVKTKQSSFDRLVS
jgi:hypothetical protein